jgi:hypothetical protein
VAALKPTGAEMLTVNEKPDSPPVLAIVKVVLLALGVFTATVTRPWFDPWGTVVIDAPMRE